MLGCLLLVPGLVLSAYLGSPVSLGLPDPVGTRGLAAVLVLLVVLPTAAAAWLMPPGDPYLEGGLRQKRLNLGSPTALAAVLVAALSCAWVIGVQVAPVSVATLITVPAPQLDWSGGSCGSYAAVAGLARGFGPSLRMEAQVCWNGQSAYPANDRVLPQPTGLLFASSSGAPSLCSPALASTNFGALTKGRCSVWVDAQGTVHVQITALAGSGLPFLGKRHLVINLAVASDGRVLHLT